MKRQLLPFLLAAFALPGAVLAAGGGSDPVPQAAPKDPVIQRAETAIEQKDWAGAQGVLRDGLQRNPGNADYHNLYAYSIRKGPNPDMSQVFQHYNEALRINPKHKGAHEYLGEAYLMVGNVAKAKEHLAQLDKLCFFGCSEFTELKNAIGDYEKRVAKQ
jgi:tetratricopeptide (TPR) repeat protein